MIYFVISIIFIISLVSAVRSLHELEAPPEIKKLMKKRKPAIGGVILFLKKKVVHYSENQE